MKWNESYEMPDVHMLASSMCFNINNKKAYICFFGHFPSLLFNAAHYNMFPLIHLEVFTFPKHQLTY